MNIPEQFIRRPVMTTLVMAAILIFGVIAYGKLPVSDLPNVDFPTIQVSANLPGASPETMASAVATPLEREFSTIAGVDSMSSTNTLGSTRITIQFSLDRDIDAAAQDVQSMISKAVRKLPDDMPTPPSYQKVNPADQPILYLAMTSPTLPLSDVNEYADTIVSQRISSLKGVAQVQVYGSQKYAVRIQLDPGALASRGIGIEEVANAISGANVNLPTGVVSGPEQSFVVQTHGQLMDAEAFKGIIVAYPGGMPVRLGDLGTVTDGVENNKAATWRIDTRAIVLAILRQPGTNTIEVVDSIRALLPQFNKQLPASVNLHVLYDRSVSIRESVHDVKFTLLLSICLVVLVIFLFLKNISATMIPALALPISIVGTFAAMYLFGFSVDNLSLMALTLSVGFVVDDAIVMLENIVRHMERGEPVMEAAFKGSREIGFTILSMTISLVAVFIPVLLMGGIIGRLLNEFAITITMAILVSGFVSLSLTPMLCSRFLKPHGKDERHGRVYMALENGFQALLNKYEWSLKIAMHHRLIVLLGSVLMLVATVMLFGRMPKGFLPNEDTGQIFAITESAPGTSFDSMVRHQKMLADIVKKDPNIEAFMSSVNTGGSSRMFMLLKPRKERFMTAEQILQSLRPKLAQVPGISAFMQIPPPIRLGSVLSKSQYQYTLQGTDTTELFDASVKMEKKLREITMLQDVTSDLELKNPQVEVKINRDRAASLGISAQRIEDTLYSAYGSKQVSTIYAPENEYAVIMELLPQYQQDPEALSSLYVRSASGQLVPLGALAEIEKGVGPLSVNHLGQLSAVTLSFNVKEGIALSQAVQSVEDAAKDALPATVNGSFQGTAQAFKGSQKGMLLLLIMSILVIYLVLGVLYESFVHPLTILSGLPSAGFGALVTLMLFGRDLNLYGFVGVILLVGIVKKNSIMMIDFAIEAQRRSGKGPMDAIVEGCTVRFRPIMMTTMAALAGTMPIAFGIGAGGDSRKTLGLAVVGGLMFSQLLTLYVTPVVYTYMDAFRIWISGVSRRRDGN